MPDGTRIPAIVFNGNQIPTAADMQTMYENEMPACHYEVQSYDCHILNRDEPLKGFSETLVLVPNLEKGRTRGSMVRNWLIQSQTFRLVV
jgi:NTF2-related export protein 1/2